MNALPIVKEVAGNYAIQASNILIPLVLLGLGAHVGEEEFSTVATSLAFSTWGILISDYGYSTLGVQRASRSRSINSFRRRLASALIIRGGISLAFALLSMLLLISVPEFTDFKSFALFQLAGIVTAITPLWFLQGRKLLSKVFWIYVSSRALLLLCITPVGLLMAESDLMSFPVFASASLLAANIIILVAVFHFLVIKRNVKFCVPAWYQIKRNVRFGRYIFATTFLTTGYTVALAPIISLTVSPIAGGYYFTAERVLQALKSVSIPALNSTLPYLSGVKTNGFDGVKWLLHVALKLGAGAGIFSVLVYFFLLYAVQLGAISYPPLILKY